MKRTTASYASNKTKFTQRVLILFYALSILILCVLSIYDKPNEDMILALAGQFKQLSHEPEKFR